MSGYAATNPTTAAATSVTTGTTAHLTTAPTTLASSPATIAHAAVAAAKSTPTTLTAAAATARWATSATQLRAITRGKNRLWTTSSLLHTTQHARSPAPRAPASKDSWGRKACAEPRAAATEYPTCVWRGTT